MKAMDYTSFAASGTASASGFSRCNFLHGLIRMFSSNSHIDAKHVRDSDRDL